MLGPLPEDSRAMLKSVLHMIAKVMAQLSITVFARTYLMLS